MTRGLRAVEGERGLHRPRGGPGALHPQAPPLGRGFQGYGVHLSTNPFKILRSIYGLILSVFESPIRGGRDPARTASGEVGLLSLVSRRAALLITIFNNDNNNKHNDSNRSSTSSNAGNHSNSDNEPTNI